MYFNEQRCILGRAQQAKHAEQVEAFPIASRSLRRANAVMARPTERFITPAPVIHCRAVRHPVCRATLRSFFLSEGLSRAFPRFFDGRTRQTSLGLELIGLALKWSRPL